MVFKDSRVPLGEVLTQEAWDEGWEPVVLISMPSDFFNSTGGKV